MIDMLERYRGTLLGLACGDAVGTRVEFQRPAEFEAVTDMLGGGPFGLQPGQSTDDTAMALCLAESLLTCNGIRLIKWQRLIPLSGRFSDTHMLST